MHPGVLLVENNERESRLLKLILEGEGYGVVTASSGWAAIEIVKSSSFDLAIIDFGLYDMKGDELAIELKKELPHISLVLLTGFLPAIDLLRLEKFDKVLEKPIHPKKILETIKQILLNRSNF